MHEIGREIAAYDVISQITRERGIPFEQAQAFYHRVLSQKRGSQQLQFGSSDGGRITGPSSGKQVATARTDNDPK